MRKPILERFIEKVQVQSPNDCWLWQGPPVRGYGQFIIEKGVMVKAHRLAWQLAYGDIPQDISVCHHCDTPLCVRPTHLFLGTHADNMTDKRLKGRAPSRMFNGNAKLDEADVLKIKDALAEGEFQKSIAKRFGVCQSTISRIHRGTNWV